MPVLATTPDRAETSTWVRPMHDLTRLEVLQRLLCNFRTGTRLRLGNFAPRESTVWACAIVRPPGRAAGPSLWRRQHHRTSSARAPRAATCLVRCVPLGRRQSTASQVVANVSWCAPRRDHHALKSHAGTMPRAEAPLHNALGGVGRSSPAKGSRHGWLGPVVDAR
eukprot:COSAG02_NODE_5372_length_4392_cov_1.744468_8_plen_166_part_00